eukprot:gnl/TRDRNA2_/TRDRNA2_186130_c0_seq1.p1 gnl/TRDRNA2_/TRDRNA2_186130_c0~~gnl/TRDRNA2_/TRDRNA2_186130_c0_seq1.p1  ORF type:complete len:311 (-),score=59.96 gnl/TRDRNA2_/TRDRNA2_186130_c0_seq1:33-965(-)
MLIPIMLPQGPPSPLQLKMRPAMTTIVSAQLAVAVCRFVASDIWGGICDLMVVVIGYFAATEMVIMYTVWYGGACAVNCFFDGLNIILRIVKWRGDYFNLQLGFFFNLYSFAILAAFVVAFAGATVSYLIWRDFQRNAGEGMPLFEPPGGGGTFAMPPPAPWAAPDPTPDQFQVFQGQGHRLSSVDELPPPPKSSPPQPRQQRPAAAGDARADARQLAAERAQRAQQPQGYRLDPQPPPPAPAAAPPPAPPVATDPMPPPRAPDPSMEDTTPAPARPPPPARAPTLTEAPVDEDEYAAHVRRLAEIDAQR